MKNRRLFFLIALAVPLIMLVSLTIKPILTLQAGTPVTLETIHTDPRDVLYGDYVYLRFEVEELDRQYLNAELRKTVDEAESYGEVVVYAVLQQQGDLYTLQEVTLDRPTDGVFLKGTMNYYPAANMPREDNYYARFLPDQFHVADSTRTELESLSRSGRLLAHLKVRNGFAIIESVEAVE